MIPVKGFTDVLIGLQYGDEGKARVIDNIAEGYDIIARFNGGPNAGHTIEHENNRIALHQIPSGIFHKNMLLYIGSGCVLNPVKLIQEIKEIEHLGISLEERLHISGQATMIQPHHIVVDSLYGKDIGTTGNGIGPAYSDQALRSVGTRIKNLRVEDALTDISSTREIIRGNYEDICHGDSKKKDGDTEKWIEAVSELISLVCKDPLWLDRLVRDGKKVLFEGAQATMLDVVKGTVPYVTSSHTIAGAAYVGGDISPNYHRKTIGVAKSIMSRVGNGPFISEFGGIASEEYCADDGGRKHTKFSEQVEYLPDELFASGDFFKMGIALRMLGDEYGATTKRPRRMGMLDLVLLAQNCRVNGVTELYLNKMDCLIDFNRIPKKGIPIVTGYELEGEVIKHIPNSTATQRMAKPVIEYLAPLTRHISNVRSYEELPEEAKMLLQKIENEIRGYGCKIAGIGIGQKREQFILL